MQDAKSASAVKYFFGRISRDQAEETLKSAGVREGLYLLRESIEQAGNYVLSICHQGGYVTSGHVESYIQPTTMAQIWTRVGSIRGSGRVEIS